MTMKKSKTFHHWIVQFLMAPVNGSLWWSSSSLSPPSSSPSWGLLVLATLPVFLGSAKYWDRRPYALRRNSALKIRIKVVFRLFPDFSHSSFAPKPPRHMTKTLTTTQAVIKRSKNGLRTIWKHFLPKLSFGATISSSCLAEPSTFIKIFWVLYHAFCSSVSSTEPSSFIFRSTLPNPPSGSTPSCSSTSCFILEKLSITTPTKRLMKRYAPIMMKSMKYRIHSSLWFGIGCMSISALESTACCMTSIHPSVLAISKSVPNAISTLSKCHGSAWSQYAPQHSQMSREVGATDNCHGSY
mmetsp:Transcript_1796/g.3985  ORF Transcript_1796/g.3985 Transcript_1796/m.3985 type:complete len:298 (-) Transcript_1796:47-940(-)